SSYQNTFLEQNRLRLELWAIPNPSLVPFLSRVTAPTRRQMLSDLSHTQLARALDNILSSQSED
ncbi:hypothetical protein, partial [Candidatus Similichlamydia laticola]|uniref:hypothetical protein n=1 Tax=Candidatus Similichlamydia laticola TaxID=2170265 RepID=UPI001C69ECEB